MTRRKQKLEAMAALISDEKGVNKNNLNQQSVTSSRELGEDLLTTPRPNSPLGFTIAAVEAMSGPMLSPEQGTVIEKIDPYDCIDCRIHDRLDVDDDPELSSLVESISTSGQQVPILLRRHPEETDKYEIAYGHRRVRACKVLDISVKAVVKELSDEAMFLALGQENNERKNTSFIEKAWFAKNLSNEFPISSVAKALGKDRGNTSRMIQIARCVSEELIKAIGKAPSIGRLRWEELRQFEPFDLRREPISSLITSESWQALPSDERFIAMLALCQKKLKDGEAQANKVAGNASQYSVEGVTGAITVKIGMKKGNIACTNIDFAKFLESKMNALIDEYESSQMDT